MTAIDCNMFISLTCVEVTLLTIVMSSLLSLSSPQSSASPPAPLLLAVCCPAMTLKMACQDVEQQVEQPSAAPVVEDPAAPPPALDALVPSQHVDLSAPPWLLRPLAPPGTLVHVTPLGSLNPLAPHCVAPVLGCSGFTCDARRRDVA
ncbi:hypothetical protein PO909_026946 [Leuciscus waleckii]